MCGGRPLAAGADGTKTALELLFFFYYYCALCCYIRGSVYSYSSLLLTVLSVFAGRRFHMHYSAFLSLFPSLCKGGDLGTAMHVMRAVTQ